MLTERFLCWAKQTPDALAIREVTRTMTYGELLARAQSVAARLASLGITSGDRVAIQLDKNHEAVATLLGILLVGAAYVPIDPRAPSLRAASILEDCRPRALIATVRYYDRLASDLGPLVEALEHCLVIGACAQPKRALDLLPTDAPFVPPEIDPESPAYILYTSGSTGRPKGVEISRRAARAFVDWACDYFAFTAQDRLTNFAPLSFDLSILDLFAALSVGASTTLIAPEQLLLPRSLVAQLRAWDITTLYAVPSTVQLLVEDGGASSTDLPALRRLLYAGERFPVRALRSAMAALSLTRFYNLFGPTETNVCTCHAFETAPAEEANDVPIGRACAHLTVELLDESNHPVAEGQTGELCVSGTAVMTGYFGNPEASRDAFLEAPGVPRRYRTGDYARLEPDGTYWFLGRRDRLVKRRGYRLELGELESALLRHPEIREAAVSTEPNGPQCSIVAYVVLTENSALTPLGVRAHCGRLLMPYQVPDAVKILPTLPRTLTGKLDFLAMAT